MGGWGRLLRGGRARTAHPPAAVLFPLQSLRLKTAEYEMIVAQHGNYTLVVVQDTEERPEEEGEEDEEGEGKKEE